MTSELAWKEYETLVHHQNNGQQITASRFEKLGEKIEASNEFESDSYQRYKWMKLRKDIETLILQLSRENIKDTAVSLFGLNLNRGKGILIRSIIKQQIQEPKNTAIYSSLISIINLKITDVGKVLGSRLIVQFKKNYIRNNRRLVRNSITFMCQLVNQRVINEIIILEILQILLDKKPTSQGIELSCEIIKLNGKLLMGSARSAFDMIITRLRNLMGEISIDEKGMQKIENIFRLSRNQFRFFKILEEDLDLIEEEDQTTHIIDINDEIDMKIDQDYYEYDGNYEDNEKAYENIRKDILGDDEEEDEEDEEEEEEVAEEGEELQEFKDMTESNLLNYQKTIYLTIMSSMSSDEAVHKLIKLNQSNQQKDEVLIDMIIKCCSQEKTYSKYYGVIGEKMILMKKWHSIMVQQFKHTYGNIHEYENNQIRNVGKFFGHLFASDKLSIEDSWDEIIMTEEETNLASRVFIKFIFQEMIEEIGIKTVHSMIRDDAVKGKISGLFPVNGSDLDHVRFLINYFTAIGLGVLTEEMRLGLAQLSRGRSRSISSHSSYSRSGSSSRSRSYSRSRSNSP